MPERTIFTRPDGGISIISLPSGLPAERHAEAITKAAGGRPTKTVPTATIPTERAFRNAWRESGTGIRVDIPEAKAIAHEKRRQIRDNLFAPLDREATIPNKAVAAEASRQAIRVSDAKWQGDINSARTESELLAVLSEAEDY